MEKASFSIANFYFDKVNIDLEYRKGKTYDVSIKPRGVFDGESKSYELTFDFEAFSETEEDSKTPFVSLRCVGEFEFENVNSLEDIPSFFYKNALALLFPYLRSFISSVTIQLNRSPLMLPTLNLSSLESVLIEKTDIKK
ncbi:protein-export chaperone SecB [Leeuwenhoekiella nanhaiensis]|uniref:Preprotein translocase subunit SecB n=1 Tax=Leeuwenhoekiella nanhaiensis TaxID=1655491 RepID=A0A2G1VWG0_9FLAO|nr:protein-export chaperone SecB [Leeuwenhoekiella nanhaiensis]PHQ31123.1 hypothetical protein CJ305_02575 [Leeuwenhoekiella nanhaiensis]